MKTAYIIDVVRTPVGRYGGALSGIRADDLLAQAIKSLISRNPQVDPGRIEDVIAGDANQAGEDCRNVARMSALLAGLPVSVAGNTVNRLCASGLQAIIDCARAIMCGEGQLYIAGGVENMSRSPFIVDRDSARSGQPELVDSSIGWRFTNQVLAEMYYPYSMGETAENIARQWRIGREEQDEYAYRSYTKYYAALEADRWKEEITPVYLPAGKKGVRWLSEDEHPRKTSLEKLSKLKPAFSPEGTVTAGNSSGLNDGAAAMLLADEKAVNDYGLQPLARIVSVAITGVDPSVMGIGPVPATRKALERAGLKMAEVELIELNESFASQAIACIRDLDLDPSKVNVNGGSIAIGHPLGCSGVRISATLLHEMQRRGTRYGLATMCAGLGQGASVIYERLGKK